ncbi:asparagine synthase C-terminal domain-containing protein [Luteimonas sp. RC10]|uniref:asparagine synthase-related protein n=1 Tax=Luteimonas sp. RC10 TaxID=2587035 RepID=UPI001610CEE1|nr:asparagine synthase C-terminal domain-containing protein [Luteimonas sp. RC10]MBB3344751.1 asparagine synthase (glutamine-hydrolyzing) [Luteimonas sp. RC10]
MPYRYIAIVDDDQPAATDPVEIGPKLNEIGLSLRLSSATVQLYADKHTPVLEAPGGGAIIGHLFRRDGAPVRRPEDLPRLNSAEDLRSVLLTQCWGDYLLIQPGDASSGALSITRDPSGGVPCVYAVGARGGFVTSDVSLAVRIGLYRREIDWDFLPVCLTYPHAMTARTALAQVTELLPGCTLLVRGSSTHIEQVWSPWDFVTDERRVRNPDEAARRVRDAVLSSIQAWAGIDSNILVEVSGGLDSSIIGASLVSTGADVSCHTLFTPVPGADERQYATLVANMLGAPLHARELDFPTARFDAAPPPWSVAPRINVLQHALNEAMAVAGGSETSPAHYSGGGGDVIFCYLGNAAPAADAVRARGLLAGSRAIGDLSQLHQCTRWKAARLTFNKLTRPPKAPYDADRTLLREDVPNGALDTHPWFQAPDDALPGDRERIQYLAGTQLYRHGMWRGPARQLRLPLLSQPVVEACLTVPSWMWVAGGRNRSVARAAFSDLLPTEVLNRKSKGDFAQYLGAVYRRNSERMRRFLLDGELNARGFLATAELDAFFRKTFPSRDQSFFRILDLCMIENWVRHQR